MALTTYARAEKRQGYARLYLAVRDGGAAAMCDVDGLLLAWTEWADARKSAGLFAGYVVNWETFNDRFLPTLTPRPPAMRIINVSHRGRRIFRAELDASPDELRTLNQFTPTDRANLPAQVRARLAKAKVVEETK